MPYYGDKKREYDRQWIAARRKEWFDKNGPCKFCQSADNLELHHLDPTIKEHHRVWSWSEERRNKELDKCIVLCYDCHLIETKKQFSKFVHGTKTMYRSHKCRCEVCKEHMRQYWKELHALQRSPEYKLMRSSLKVEQ